MANNNHNILSATQAKTIPSLYNRVSRTFLVTEHYMLSFYLAKHSINKFVNTGLSRRNVFHFSTIPSKNCNYSHMEQQ